MTVLDERASHPCAIVRGDRLDVFVKVGDAAELDLECRGLRLVQRLAGARVPEPLGPGVVNVGDATLLLLEALDDVAPADRGRTEWRAIGDALASLHAVTDTTFGLTEFDGSFGPLPQDNRPLDAGWTTFWRERRIEPFRGAARRSGHLPAELDRRVDGLLERLDALAGDEPLPTLVHGDAQQHNFVNIASGAALIDVAPYFGHPEVDLAMLDIFEPVPADVVDVYRARRPLAVDAADRVELWRLPAYLAIVAVDGSGPFGRSFLTRLVAALTSYGV